MPEIEKFVQEATFSISGGTDETRSLRGNFIQVYQATSEFSIVVDESYTLTVKAGSKFKVEPFQNVRIVSAVTQTIILKYGFGDYDESSSSVSISSTAEVSMTSTGITSSADVSCPTATATNIITAHSGKRVIIQRTDSVTGYVRIGDSGVGASEGLRLGKDGVLTLESNAAVWLRNDLGSNVTVAILIET